MNAPNPPESWTCPNCQAENFGSRRTCLSCGASKPVLGEPPPAPILPGSMPQPGGEGSPGGGTLPSQPATSPALAPPRLGDTQPTIPQPAPQTRANLPLEAAKKEPGPISAKMTPVSPSPTKESQAPTDKRRRKPNRLLTGCSAILLVIILCLASLYLGRNRLVAQIPSLSWVKQLVNYFQPTAEMLPSTIPPAITPTDLGWLSYEQRTEEATPQVQELSSVTYANISFSYDPQLAQEVIPLTQPAILEPMIVAAPEHYLFEFKGYPGGASSTVVPEMRVYPVAEYEAANMDASLQIESLRQAVKSFPSLPDASLPYLPLIPAAQLITARINRVDFQNGTGLRYLTQFGQDVYPINNANLLYTYQGLTANGQYYVSVTLPIQSSSLPADGSQVSYDYQEFANSFLEYVSDTVQLLEQDSIQAFTPNIDLLDGMIATLLIKP